MTTRVRLGASPLEVARLGVGCWAWGDRRYWRYGEDFGPHDVVDAFDAYTEAGLDLFDTAETYGAGRGEQILGWLARRCGRKLVIATKYAPIAGRGGPAAIRKGLLASMARLGGPRIDLYQLHWADRDEVPIAATMAVLAEAVHVGQIGAVGISNFRAGEMRDAHDALARHGVPLATVQVHYSLLHRTPEVDGIIDACRELGVTMLAYSPLEQGLLTGKYTTTLLASGPRGETASFAAANIDAAQTVLSTLRAIAAAYAVEPAAAALAWLLAKSPPIVPLVGAKNGGQARRNAEALTLRLDDAAIAALDAVSLPWRAIR